MKFVIFGLSVTSSWGNGHATLWRGLCRSLAHRGHDVWFYERDVPYYALHRDIQSDDAYVVRLYSEWSQIRLEVQRAVRDADVAIVTSYCPDGKLASELLFSSRGPLRIFYDLDSPVTLNHIRLGQPVDYLPVRGLEDFDLVLSYTGGRALQELRTRLGAKRVAPLYGSVDPNVHKPAPVHADYRADLSYLGTYAQDRQQALEELFVEPARRLSTRSFLIGGALYPLEFPWLPNMFYRQHVAPHDHPSFYCSSTLTLNVTRGVMAEMGYCPSGRLFEAAACGATIVSDTWEGLERFFEPGREILVVRNADEMMEALARPLRELSAIGANARRRVLAEHTSDHRAEELLRWLESLPRCKGMSDGQTAMVGA